MGYIKVMDSHLSNMIAAGEVVDRPANIVKECVENALDAGASFIEIEVFQGGIDGVVITDDGCGMDEEDAFLCFSRHATSKLLSQEDLFNIQTMGFRGEALASIAAVSKVDLQTNDGSGGSHIRFEYGKNTAKEAYSCPRGTRIEVTGLFLQTPARFKYLKRPGYEFSVIADLINKLSIANPNVRFVLKHDGRLIYQTSGKGNRKQILYAMYGREVAENAVEFSAVREDFQISGLAVQPRVSRANKNFIYVTMNGRLIKSWHLINAVVEGYREYLPKDRYPIVILNIEMDPQLVDVNVHPNKMDVRISKEEYLQMLIVATLERLFASELITPEISLNSKEKPKMQPYAEQGSLDFGRSVISASNARPSNEGAGTQRPKSEKPEQTKRAEVSSQPVLPKTNPAGIKSEIHHPAWVSSSPAVQVQNTLIKEAAAAIKPEEKTETKSDITGNKPDFISEKGSENQILAHSENDQVPESTNLAAVSENSGVIQDPKAEFETNTENQPADDSFESLESEQTSENREVSENPESEKGHEFFDHLKIIGQLKDSYILCENPNGLVIIDQHAAQERFHFEQLVEQFSKPCTQFQPRIIPHRITVPADLFEQSDLLNSYTKPYGLIFEPFGNNQLLIREDPIWFMNVNQERFLEDLISWFVKTRKVDMEALRRHMIATMACHSSIRFNRKLTWEEMEQVIKDLQSCKQPYHCPHGRPTVITLADANIRKEFERG